MAANRWMLCLCLGWGCLCLALGDVLRARWVGLRRRNTPAGVRGGRPRAAAGDYGPGQRPEPEEQRRPERLQPEDKVSEHMLRLYDQYSGGHGGRAAQRRDLPGLPGLHLRHGNTVRGFRPRAAGECGPRRGWAAGGGPAGPCGTARAGRIGGQHRGSASPRRAQPGG